MLGSQHYHRCCSHAYRRGSRSYGFVLCRTSASLVSAGGRILVFKQIKFKPFYHIKFQLGTAVFRSNRAGLLFFAVFCANMTNVSAIFQAYLHIANKQDI